MKLILLNWGFLYPHVRTKREPKNHPKYKKEVEIQPTWETKAPHEKCEGIVRLPIYSFGKEEPTGYSVGYEIDSEYLVDLIKMYDIMSFDYEDKIYVYLDVKGKRCRQR